MSTQSGRLFRGRLSDGKHDDFIFKILAQLDEFNLRLKILESQISKPNDQEVVDTIGETFEANKCEKDKKEEEQIATKCVYINQGFKLKGCRTQRVPQ